MLFVETRSKKLRWAELLCALLVLISAQSATLFGAENISESPGEFFKNYLKNCPPVREIIFWRQSLAVPNFPGEPVPHSVTNIFRNYVGAWQTNGFFLREVRDIGNPITVIGSNAFTADLLISGRNDKLWWDIINNQVTSWSETSDAKSSSVRRKAELAEGILFPVLWLGLNNLKPGTLEWSGNEFTALTTSGQILKGTLTLRDGIPENLEVYLGGAKLPSYECEYHYNDFKTNGARLPSRVLRYKSTNGVKTPSWVAEIVRIEIAREEQLPAAFSPQSFLGKEHSINYVITNGGEYKVQGNALLKLPGIDLLPEKPMQTGRKRVVVWSVLVASILTLAVLIWCNSKQKKHI